MELTVITGMSGAGKSGAMGVFEDAGCFCIDNLPPRLLPSLVDLFQLEGTPVERIAVACDLRGGVWFEELTRQLERLQEIADVTVQMIFLDATDEALVNRFRETRRRHPLATGGSLTEAIERERTLLAQIRERADQVIDTTGLNVWELREAIGAMILDPSARPAMRVSFLSFGFKHGGPRDADIVLDVRFLRNPHYVPDLGHLTGLDEPVAAYVAESPGMPEFRERLEGLLDFLLPAYAAEGRRHLVVAIGCTGGRHRSVAISALLAERARSQGYLVDLRHRDMERPR